MALTKTADIIFNEMDQWQDLQGSSWQSIPRCETQTSVRQSLRGAIACPVLKAPFFTSHPQAPRRTPARLRSNKEGRNPITR